MPTILPRPAACAHALAAIAMIGSGLPLHAEEQAPPEPVRIVPAGKWNIDYGVSDCLMQRAFEADGKRYLVSISQSAPGRTFGLKLAGPEISRTLGAKELSLALSDSGPATVEGSVMSAKMPEFGPTLIFTGVSLEPRPPADAPPVPRGAGIDPATAATANRIALDLGKGKPGIRFETGALKSVFAALNTCTDDMLTQWGLDPAQHRAYVAPVFRNAMAVVTQLQKTYPRDAAVNRESGIFSFRLIIEADGTISDCQIEALTKVNDLDPRCREVIRIAKFDPARDAAGQPMRSFYATTVTYLTP